MNVRINIDVVENMLKLHHRRGEKQKCVFALILGTISDLTTYNVTDCLYRFIYFNENYENINDKKVSN